MTRLSGTERRAQILAAAREEFLRTGPDGARISDIADRAGINVALLYRHFESKEQLFDAAIVEPLIERLGQLVDEVTAQVTDPDDIEELTRVFYRALLAIFLDTIEVLGVVLFSDRAAGHVFYQKTIVPFLDNLVEVVRISADRAPQKLSPEITVPVCVGMCWGIALDGHFRDSSIDFDVAAAAIASITRHGLITT